MRENTKYQFVKFENRHLDAARYIFDKAFNFKVTAEFLKSKYNTDHLNIDSISTIAFDDNKPIAFYGAIPQKFSSKNNSSLVAHACDSYTLPQYQKQGIHRDLALKSYDLMSMYGISMVYAFHSENTFYSTKKLNWKEHHSLARFELDLSNKIRAKLLFKLGRINTLDKRISKHLNEYTIESYPNPIIKDGLLGQVYSTDYYDYKDKFNFHKLICIEECTIYLKFNTVVNVGYFDCPDKASFDLAMAKLTDLLAQIGYDKLLFQVDPASNQYHLLKTLKTPLNSWLIGYLPFEEQFNIKEYGFNFADLDTF